MSQIHRYCQEGPVAVDVGLIQWIEGVTSVDSAPPPEVIAPLAARAEAHRDAMRSPEYDDELVADTQRALNGCWLYLDEIHAVQRLRGWHRARYGKVTVDAYWLARARNVLDNLTLSLEGECDEMAEGCDPSERAAVLKSMKETGTCGECQWCQALRLRDQCDAILDAAGYYGGSRYEAYCNPTPHAAA